jgi:peptide/nickel transport system permease protein
MMTPAQLLTPVRAVRAVARRVRSSTKASIGMGVLLLFSLVAVLAPLIAGGDPQAVVAPQNEPPSASHLLGTTGQGGDVFAQIIWGARDSLLVGLSTGIAVTVVGVLVGLCAAYTAGLIDNALTLLTNIFLVIPGLPLLVVMAAFLPHSTFSTVIVLAIAGWAGTARVIRSQALSIVKRDYVAAARVIGEGRLRIILVEILPNLSSLIASSLFGAIAYGISAQAALEFLGLGNLNSVSWGTILYWSSNNASLLQGAWWQFIPAGACIAIASGALALLNFAVDEITNPRLRTVRAPRPSALKRRRPVGEELSAV